MVTTLCIVGILIGIGLGSWGLEDDFFPAYIGGFLLTVYLAVVLMSHHASTGPQDDDFTIPKIVKAAEKAECRELVLRKGEYPVCVTGERKEKDFVVNQWSDTLPPFGRWKEQHEELKYREVTGADVDMACLRVVKSYRCESLDTLAVIVLEGK